MQRKALVSLVGGSAAVVAVGGVGTYLLSGTESNTRLSQDTTVTVDGHKALRAAIVEGRTQSKYHPLPWVGTDLSDMTCPSGLKAVKGATLTCTGKGGDGKKVSIPVSVVKVSDSSITWKFSR